jgi:aminomethyltransferase
MAGSLLHTPLHDWHAAHGGRLVDFAGWEMPVQYTSIVAEHQATRTAAGVFDISHMGRLLFRGAGAPAFLDRIVTRRVSDMRPGQIRYALVTNDSGGILDDVLVYARAGKSPGGPPMWMLVVNASNRLKIVDWLLEQNLERAANCEFHDATTSEAMIAVQGPRAADLLAPLFDDAHQALRYYHCAELHFPERAAKAGVDTQSALVSRTGYTGEDGWEIIVAAGLAVEVWQRVLEAGQSLKPDQSLGALPAAGVLPAGLGARDTLRLEAAMPLYGHELSETIDPYQAGLGFAVDLEGRAFPGRDALLTLRDRPDAPVRVGWLLAGRRVPRDGFPVVAASATVGHVTSGTFSPTLDAPIAMGYSQRTFATPGCEVAIDIRGRQEPARVVALPFYRRSTQGSKK